ncbi:hypothetical protein EUTSA_v10027198mg [Eutrema salsugineum]|uniref:PGG domain-containing protein n=1 Tax=Eutrema salsugineum TaxID=72664 RepID=V4P7Z7_EUTSA|nr:hypothetical protein EUTSA_v10027198mg [Eutrema salsugineum]
MAAQNRDVYERLDNAAEVGDIETLYQLIAEDPNVLRGHYDKVPFRETPLHIAARNGQSHFAMELMTLKPSLALKLNTSGLSPMHLALQNNHIRTVLLGWVKRVNREEILDWKDEDGNTVFHIAALTNQTEVMKLLRGTVKVNAKNLDGKTAMDILQAHQSPRFPEASRLLRRAKEILHFGRTMSLAVFLSEKPSPIEKQNKLLGLNPLIQTRHRSSSSNDSRSAVLVVAILVVTATYQAGLSPPGGFWQETVYDDDVHFRHDAGQMTMSFNNALFFFFLNGIAFFSSLYVTMKLIIGLPMWMVLYGSTMALGSANYTSFIYTLPDSTSPLGGIAVSLLLLAYPVITALIIFPPIVAFFVNKSRRHNVDFSARYFSSSQELS